jgi:hypothetical protein
LAAILPRFLDEHFNYVCAIDQIDSTRSLTADRSRVRGLDPAPEPKSTVAEVSEAVKGTVHRIGDAIDKGRKPGMPLSILSNIAREAPLGSLLAAFLLGVAVARRR